MKTIIGAFALLSISTAFSFCILEFGIRSLIGTPLKEKLPLVRVVADPVIGWRMIPGDQHYTYTYPVSINNIGFRGPDVGSKREGEYRILAIGDSYTYGQGIRDDDLYTTRLNELLNKDGSTCEFNVINMGARAYSINNEVGVLEKQGLPLNPDHVVVFFYLNDFVEDSIDLSYSYFKQFDWYTFDFQGKPTDALVRKWNLIQIARKSAALLWIKDIIASVRFRDSLETRMTKGIVDSETDKAMAYVKGNITRMSEIANENDVRLTFAMIPTVSQVAGESARNIHYENVRKHAADLSIETIDLSSALRDVYAKEGKLPVIPFDGHYNAKGQALIADEASRQLLPLATECTTGHDQAVTWKG